MSFLLRMRYTSVCAVPLHLLFLSRTVPHDFCSQPVQRQAHLRLSVLSPSSESRKLLHNVATCSCGGTCFEMETDSSSKELFSFVHISVNHSNRSTYFLSE